MHAYKPKFWTGNLQMLLRKQCLSWYVPELRLQQMIARTGFSVINQ